MGSAEWWCFFDAAITTEQLRYLIRSTMKLWRDVFAGSTHIYYQLFYEMEHTGILDPDNKTQLFALHFVYLPRINRSLPHFAAGFNNTPMSTENCISTMQLWARGFLEERAEIDISIEEYVYYDFLTTFFININHLLLQLYQSQIKYRL